MFGFSITPLIWTTIVGTSQSSVTLGLFTSTVVVQSPVPSSDVCALISGKQVITGGALRIVRSNTYTLSQPTVETVS